MNVPLLMIPGPVEISPAVREAAAAPPAGHLSKRVIEAFGASLAGMRRVWLAGAEAQPFLVPGSGTTAMEMAAANLVEPGDAVIVVNTGYFSSRMEEMLRRSGAHVRSVPAGVGEAPALEAVRTAFDGAGVPVKALFATHVDTSTAVRLDPEPLARLARERGALSVFDGVCATAAEPFRMDAWEADVYYTASQKAIGAPAGLALAVVSPRAIEARRARSAPPALALDWLSWLPVMRAYEEGRPAYFATPPTTLVVALEVALREIQDGGMEARFELHARAARGMRAAFDALGLRRVPVRDDLAASTLSALYYPDGADASLVGRVLDRGVAVAGGLHPAIRDRSFRVGHMGYAVTRPDLLERTVVAVAGGLGAAPERAVSALRNAFDPLC